MKNAILVIACTVVLSGCYQTPSYTPVTYTPPPSPPASKIERGTPIKLTAAQIAVVKAGTAKGMKDPESARFGDTFLAAKDSKGVITVCGYVNGKNSYGGYVGMSPFIGVLGEGAFGLVDIGSSRDGRPITVKLCQDSGIDGIS